MYKNQLQELAQRSCFNLPSYGCTREGPDHAPRFKATVNFNGEIFESPNYCSTLRQAEHSAAEVALNTLSRRGPSRSLAAKVLDETGVYKNLLQETAHRAGLSLPVYTTTRSGPGHLPVFKCSVDLAGLRFYGETAKTKKQAEKNAAMAAWSALKQLSQLSGLCSSSCDSESSEEQEQITIARVLANLCKDEIGRVSQQQRRKLPAQRDKSAAVSAYSQQYVHSELVPRFQVHQPPAPPPASKFLPFIRSIFPQKTQQQQQSTGPGITSTRPSPVPRESYNVFNKKTEICHLPNYPMNNNTAITDVCQPPPVRLPITRSERQEIPIPLEEHQRDEDEWLHGADTSSRDQNAAIQGYQLIDWRNSAFGSGNTSSRSSYSMQTPQNFSYRNPNLSALQQQQSTTYRSSPSSSDSRCLRPLAARASPVRIRSAVPVYAAPPAPRRIRPEDAQQTLASNFAITSLNPAPAVCIRSVIPVCSAPGRPPCDRGEQHAESINHGEADGNEYGERQGAVDDDVNASKLRLSQLQL